MHRCKYGARVGNCMKHGGCTGLFFRLIKTRFLVLDIFLSLIISLLIGRIMRVGNCMKHQRKQNSYGYHYCRKHCLFCMAHYLSCFSEGQKKKTLIAKSLCERAHLYIWDEPLNYIDIYSRLQIEELLTEFRYHYCRKHCLFCMAHYQITSVR